MGPKRTNWRTVGLALLPALAISIGALLVAQFLWGRSELFAERVAQILFFPAFFGSCHYLKPRQQAPAK